MDTKTVLKYLLASMEDFPSKTEAFETIHHWVCKNNIPDELKTILLSRDTLNCFQSHLKVWNSQDPLKAIIKNLELMLILSDKLPELKYNSLSESGYLNQVLSINFSCLKFLTARNQVEIDENCALALVLSNVSKYAIKFCRKGNELSSVGQLYFKQALLFLRCKSFELVEHPNNCVYLLTLTSTLNSIMTQFSGYKSLFIELKGIEYCLNWLSKSYKDKQNIFEKLYYDLRILSILEDFVDEPYFAVRGREVALYLIKYLRCKGDLCLSSSFLKESILVFECICSILIKMAMRIDGFREYISAYGMRQLLQSFLNKNETCARAVYTTLLVLEDIDEGFDESNIMNIGTVMSKCERLSNILLLSGIYNIRLSSDINRSIH